MLLRSTVSVTRLYVSRCNEKLVYNRCVPHLRTMQSTFSSEAAATAPETAAPVEPSAATSLDVETKKLRLKALAETTPSDEVKKLAKEILSLNMVETAQYQDLIIKALGITNEQINAVGRAGARRGGSTTAAGDAGAQPAASAEKPKEKEEWDVKLVKVDAAAKIKIIKEIRTITGLGLKEAKELVEKAPVVIKQGLKKDEAEAIKKVVQEAGGAIEIL